MNGRMLDDLESLIEKWINDYAEDDKRWPDFHCPPGMARQMAKAGEVAFDACVETSQYQKKEAE